MHYRRVDGVLHQVVDGRAMLISPAGDEVLVLNRTGSVVWDALADAGDVDSLTATLHGAHPTVGTDAIRNDVTTFLAELEAAGLVVGETREPIDTALIGAIGSGAVCLATH